MPSSTIVTRLILPQRACVGIRSLAQRLLALLPEPSSSLAHGSQKLLAQALRVNSSYMLEYPVLRIETGVSVVPLLYWTCQHHTCLAERQPHVITPRGSQLRCLEPIQIGFASAHICLNAVTHTAFHKSCSSVQRHPFRVACACLNICMRSVVMYAPAFVCFDGLCGSGSADQMVCWQLHPL